MREAIDLSGQLFGRLAVIKRYGQNKSGNILWECVCVCGESRIVESYRLRKGITRSCGCIASERMAAMNYRHGMFGSRIYETWRKMRRRCRCESEKAYPRYGGRGIRVCAEWDNLKNGFQNFYRWALENGYSEKLSIDRIDNDGDYEPSNCRWADAETQCNNRSVNHKVDFKGETLTISQLARRVGIDPRNLYNYLANREWNAEAAVTAACARG